MKGVERPLLVNAKRAAFQYRWNSKHIDDYTDFIVYTTKQCGVQLLQEERYGMQKNK